MRKLMDIVDEADVREKTGNRLAEVEFRELLGEEIEAEKKEIIEKKKDIEELQKNITLLEKYVMKEEIR